MQWSNSDKVSKAVLDKDTAEQKVMEFVPIRFDLGTPEQALNYLAEKKKGSDFRMNDAVRLQTGVEQIEKENEEEKVEAAALEKLKEVQEQAYQEAYNMGLEEGRKEAFEKVSFELEEKLQGLEELLKTIGNLKTDLLSFNESHLIQLSFKMAARLAKTELSDNNEAMLQILRDAVSLSQDEENITVRVAASQFEFLESLKQETGRELDFIKRIRFEPSDDITPGGCIVETNYGEVDSRIDQRIEQMWAVVMENTPKVKDRIAG